MSDNGPQFTSLPLIFMKAQEIKHIFSAPYNPSSNGLAAEMFIQIFKRAMKAGANDGVSLRHRVASFLLLSQFFACYNQQWRMQAIVCKQSPAFAMLSRNVEKASICAIYAPFGPIGHLWFIQFSLDLYSSLFTQLYVSVVLCFFVIFFKEFFEGWAIYSSSCTKKFRS